MENYLGEIQCFAFGQIPTNWLPCDGRTLLITQYESLFALLGTNYGGNGATNFNLPNLNGRFAVGGGAVGTQGGTMAQNLTVANIPSHIHTMQGPAGTNNMLVSGQVAVTSSLMASTENATTNIPASSSMLASSIDISGNGGKPLIYYYTNLNVPLGGLSVTMNPNGYKVIPSTKPAAATGTSGGGAPVSTMPPYVVLNFCICINGIYPNLNSSQPVEENHEKSGIGNSK